MSTAATVTRELQVLTHSRLACMRACPRRHYLRYELGLRPEETSYVLRVGSAFHRALEADDKGEDVGEILAAALEDPYDLALVAAMHAGHRQRWADEPLEAVATELAFDLPLVNPDTGKPSTTWRLAGVIDRIVRLPDGRLALQEYKTTSRDFSPGGDYWVRLRMDAQLSLYVIAARELGHDVETVLYDVTRRPALRPLKATPEEARKYTKDGRLYAAQRESDEDPYEYAVRVAESIAADPAKHFVRMEIARLEQELEDFRRESWQQQLALRAMQRSGHFYRNPEACLTPYPCAYLPICGDRDLETRTPGGWVRETEIHPELRGDASLGG